MAQRQFESGVFLALAVSGLTFARCGDAIANPLPVGYADFPVAPSELVSQVSMPRIADDFRPGSSTVMVGFVGWWGSFSAGPWQITLYLNADSEPTRPDEGGSSVIVDSFDVQEWSDDIFYYAANVRDARWRLINYESHWLSVASFEPGWTWALGDGQPEMGQQHQFAEEMLATDVWAPLKPPAQMAFQVWPRGLPEPGTLALLGLGLAGLGLSRRRLAA